MNNYTLKLDPETTGFEGLTLEFDADNNVFIGFLYGEDGAIAVTLTEDE